MPSVHTTTRDLIQIRAHILCAWHAIQDPYASNQLDEACAIINEALRHAGEELPASMPKGGTSADFGAWVQALDGGDF